MRRTTIGLWFIGAALLGPGLNPAASAPALKVVGTDPAGDWFGGVGAEVGASTAQDLVKASIGRRTAGRLDFQIELAAMPSADQAQLQIYSWVFQLSTDDADVWHEISPVLSSTEGVYFNVSTCRAVQQSTGGVLQQTSECEPVDRAATAWDPARASVTWSVPVRALSTARSFSVEPNSAVFASSWVSFTVDNTGPQDFLLTKKGFTYRR